MFWSDKTVLDVHNKHIIDKDIAFRIPVFYNKVQNLYFLILGSFTLAIIFLLSFYKLLNTF